MDNRRFTKNGYEVEVIESGQRRRYGDSYYTYNVTPPPDADEAQVRAFCQTLRASKSPSEAQWYEGQTLKFAKYGETWRYEVREAYTD